MAEEIKHSESGGERESSQGSGAKPVGITGIIVVAAYLGCIALFFLYCLVVLWPHSDSSTDLQAGEVEASAGSALAVPAVSKLSPPPQARNGGIHPSTFFFGAFWLSNEVRLLLIVMLAGALGSLVHALRSMYWYVGNRSLVHSWLLMFILLPLVGATLAVIFYLVVRGGFFSPQASFKDTSPFGFAALAGLIGMFSQQAVLKLKQVAETLLTKPKQGENSKPQD